MNRAVTRPPQEESTLPPLPEWYVGSLEWVRDEVAQIIVSAWADYAEPDWEKVATDILVYLRSIGYEPQDNDPAWDEWTRRSLLD